MPARDSMLLMSLSADVLLTLLQHPNVDPKADNIANLAFEHAAQLITLNQLFANRVDQSTQAPQPH